MNKLKVVGVSSGLGVSLFPFKKEDILFNVETRSVFHTPNNCSWTINFGTIPLDKSIIRNPELVDILLSSPDCGSGSILRYSRAKKLGDHKKNKSLELFFDGVEKLKPKLILFENLEGLFKSFPEKEFRGLLKDYRLIKHIKSVSAWGNSQKDRKRLIIVGIRKDLRGLSKYFKKLPKKPILQFCGELYGDLTPEISGHYRENVDDLITIYSGKKMTLLEIQKAWDKMPKRRWVVKDRKFTTAPGVYRNRWDDYPATARKANRQFDHDGLTLTPRQLARIQGVPDEFLMVNDFESNKLKFWINKNRAIVTKTPPMEISTWFYKRIKKAIKDGKYPI